MATFKFEGVDQLVEQYSKLANNTEQIIGAAIYQGAGVVMSAIQSAVDGITTDNRFGTPDNPTVGPSTLQKIGLKYGLGIAKMRNDGGFRNVKIGFDGYNNVKTKTWPQGQPNVLVARSIESGTSWMSKQPFLRPAEQGSRAQCEEAMRKVVDEKIKQIME